MKYSLKYYASLNPLNSIITENMVDVHLLNEGFGSFEDKACNIFSKAYGICRDIINNSPVDIWKIPDYFKSAGFGYLGKDIDKIMGGITFSVVIIILDHFDENWKAENKKFLDKMLDYLKNIHITGDTIRVGSTEIVNTLGRETACITAYNILRRGADIEYVVPFEEFSIQGPNLSGEEKPLNREEQIHFIEETVKTAFEKYKDKIVEKDDIPDEDVRKMWKQALSYTKAEIEAKIPYVEYDAQNESLNISDETNYLKLKPWEEVKDMIKSYVKEYMDEEIEASDDDIDEIFEEVYGKDLVDKVNSEMSEQSAVEKVNTEKGGLKHQTDDNKLQNELNEKNELLNQEIKTNEDLRKKISTLQQTIKDYESLYNPKVKDGTEKIPILSGKEHVIMHLAILAKLNCIPNARTNLSIDMSMIAARSENTMHDYLHEAITEEECNKLCNKFHIHFKPFENMIKELPQKLKEDKSEKNRQKALNKQKD